MWNWNNEAGLNPPTAHVSLTHLLVLCRHADGVELIFWTSESKIGQRLVATSLLKSKHWQKPVAHVRLRPINYSINPCCSHETGEKSTAAISFLASSVAAIICQSPQVYKSSQIWHSLHLHPNLWKQPLTLQPVWFGRLTYGVCCYSKSLRRSKRHECKVQSEPRFSHKCIYGSIGRLERKSGTANQIDVSCIHPRTACSQN